MQLTVKHVARIFNIPEAAVYRLIKKGQLPVYRINDQYRFNRSELVEWATLNKVNMAPSSFLEPETEALLATRIADALQAGGVFYDLPGLNKEEALRAVVEIIPLPADVERDFIFHMLLAREQLASTGVGEGIAIPHPRSPILLHVHTPLVSLCFLEKAVDFGALDGKPVFALITIITANARQHLHLLSRLSFCLRDPRLRATLERRAPREVILQQIARVESERCESAGGAS
jgi:PTS system nitrogen regulatory IIA component